MLEETLNGGIMLTANYNYQETLAASVKANWRIEDIIGGDKRLDLRRCDCRVRCSIELMGTLLNCSHQLDTLGYLFQRIVVAKPNATDSRNEFGFVLIYQCKGCFVLGRCVGK